MYLVSENIFILAYQSFFASTSLLCANLPSVKHDRSPGRVCQRRGWAKIATDGGRLLYITFEIYSWFWLILSCLPYMLAGFLKTLSPSGPFTSDSVFWPKTLCRPPEKISPFLMALIPWLVLLGRRFIDAQNITLDDDRFVFDKKGCTDLMQRIGVVSQLFWQCRARENYGNLFKKSPCARKK